MFRNLSHPLVEKGGLNQPNHECKHYKPAGHFVSGSLSIPMPVMVLGGGGGGG